MKVYNRCGEIIDVYLEPHEAEEYSLEYIINNADSKKSCAFLERMIKDIGEQSGFFGNGEFTATFYKINGYGFKVSFKRQKTERVKPIKRPVETRVYSSENIDNVLDLIYAMHLMTDSIKGDFKCALYYYGGRYYLVPPCPMRMIRHLAYEFRLKSIPLKDVCDILNKAKLISADAADEIGRCL